MRIQKDYKGKGRRDLYARSANRLAGLRQLNDWKTALVLVAVDTDFRHAISKKSGASEVTYPPCYFTKLGSCLSLFRLFQHVHITFYVRGN